MDKEITFQQMMEANRYVNTYIKTMGWDPAEILTTPGFEKDLPDDVKKAWEVCQKFHQQNEDKGITV